MAEYKDQFESNHFTQNEPATQKRLEACLKRDDSNARRYPSGEHIRVIQEALRKVRAILPSVPEIPAKENGTFGVATRNATKAYKTARTVVRPGQPLDDIVGRMTIASLDTDMRNMERKLPDIPDDPELVDDGPTQDVYIRIFGYDNPGQQGMVLSDSGEAKALRKEVDETPRYLEFHKPLRTMWVVGGERVATEIIKTFEKERAKGPLGRIVIAGGSAGGKNVLEVAGDLTNKKIPIALVGVADGAFQEADKLDPVADNVRDIPLTFKSPNILTTSKQNVFQSWGHTLDPKQELHGKIFGFHNNLDLTENALLDAARRRAKIPGGFNQQAALEAAHVAAYEFGFGMFDLAARRIFKTLPP